MVEFIFETNSIVIKDAAKQQRFLVIFLLCINIFNPIIFVANSDHPLTYWLNILWLIIGVFSTLAFFYFLFKRSHQSEINRSLVKSISWKCTSLAKSISFKLTNGKVRVVSFTDKTNLNEQVQALQENGYEAV
tara:strand:- start:733 stop:1131 length:399 start_codon:yes stop_codon:yes gene_type:complete